MKKILILVMLVAFFVIPTGLQAARVQVNVDPSDTEALFAVNSIGINRIGTTNVSRLDFKVENIKQTPSIDHWKVRIWCNDDIQIGFNKQNADHCDSAIDLPRGVTPGQFSLFLSKNPEIRAEFSFKLKAYDKNGKWLHSEKEAFMW